MNSSGDKSFPQNQGNYSMTRLEAPSEVGTKFISQNGHTLALLSGKQMRKLSFVFFIEPEEFY